MNPLEEILAGQWDLTVAAKRRQQAKETNRKLAAVRQLIVKPYNAYDCRDALSAIAKVEKDRSGHRRYLRRLEIYLTMQLR